MRKVKSGAQELGDTQMNAMEKRGLSPGVPGEHYFQLSSFQSKFTNLSGGLMMCKPRAWEKLGCIRHKPRQEFAIYQGSRHKNNYP